MSHSGVRPPTVGELGARRFRLAAADKRPNMDGGLKARRAAPLGMGPVAELVCQACGRVSHCGVRRVCPPAGDELAVPAKRCLGLDRGDCPGRPGSERLSEASGARSARVGLGRELCRRRIASSGRRTRISTSFERRDRPSGHTSANRVRATRYTSDQSKQPSLDHRKRDEPSEPDARERRGGVCEPTGSSPNSSRARRWRSRSQQRSSSTSTSRNLSYLPRGPQGRGCLSARGDAGPAPPSRAARSGRRCSSLMS
jgi:hypothetical protein